MEDFKQRLIACGQKHLFHANPTAEDRENEEHILKELWQLHSENPTSGGLFAYLERAKSLLDKSKNGHNSLDKWRPTDQVCDYFNSLLCNNWLHCRTLRY